MTEGDLYRSVIGTVHIEKEWRLPVVRDQEDFKGISYWCGMRSPKSHTRVEKPGLSDLAIKEQLCSRCVGNRKRRPI